MEQNSSLKTWCLIPSKEGHRGRSWLWKPQSPLTCRYFRKTIHACVSDNTHIFSLQYELQTSSWCGPFWFGSSLEGCV